MWSGGSGRVNLNSLALIFLSVEFGGQEGWTRSSLKLPVVLWFYGSKDGIVLRKEPDFIFSSNFYWYRGEKNNDMKWVNTRLIIGLYEYLIFK